MINSSFLFFIVAFFQIIGSLMVLSPPYSGFSLIFLMICFLLSYRLYFIIGYKLLIVPFLFTYFIGVVATIFLILTIIFEFTVNILYKDSSIKYYMPVGFSPSSLLLGPFLIKMTIISLIYTIIGAIQWIASLAHQ